MNNLKEMLAMANAVAAIVQQHGQHDFPSYSHDFDDDIRTAVLCGIGVDICNGRAVRIKARDLEVLLENSFFQPANDERVARLTGQPPLQFIQGTYIELERWHSRLTRFQNVFRYTPRSRDEVA